MADKQKPPVSTTVRRKATNKFYSPNQITKWRDNPLGALVSNYLSQSSGTDLPYNAAADAGSRVHAAIEAGMKNLQSFRNSIGGGPVTGKTERKMALVNALEVAKQKLAFEDRTSSFGYVSEILTGVGDKYLKSDGDAFHAEKDVISNRIVKDRDIGGRVDLLYFDSERQTAQVIDWKTGLNPIDFKHAAQTDIYSVAASDELHHLFVLDEKAKQNVEVVYYVKEEVANHARNTYKNDPSVSVSVDKSFGKVTVSVSDDDIRRRRAKLSGEVGKIEQITGKVSSLAYSPEPNALQKYISQLVKEGRCTMDIRTCRTCPARYFCPSSKIHDDAIQGAMNANNEKTNAFSTLSKDADKQAKELVATNRQKELEQRFAAPNKPGAPGGDLYQKAFQESSGSVSDIVDRTKDPKNFRKLREMRQSYQYRQQIETNTLYNTEYEWKVDDKTKPTKVLGYQRTYKNVPLPFSFFDPEFRPGWMPAGYQQTVRNLSNEYIDEFSTRLGMTNPGLTQNQIMDDIAHSAALHGEVYQAVKSESLQLMRDKGIKVTPENMNSDLMRSYFDKAGRHQSVVASDRVTGTIRKHIEQNVLQYADRIEPEVIEKHLTPDQQKAWKKNRNLDELRGYLAPNLAEQFPEMIDDPVKWKKEMATGASTKALLEKFSLSKSKRFPLGAVMGTFVLSYMTATVNAQAQIDNKFRKEAESRSRPTTVDDGTHNSIYGITQRLVSSDFGSKVRQFEMLSGKISAWIAEGGRKALGKARDIVRGAMADDLVSPHKSFRDRTDIRNTAIKVAAGTAIGTVALSNIGSNDEIAPHIRRRKELLEDARMRRSTYTGLEGTHKVGPESELRQYSKMHTPFGSKVFSTLFRRGLRSMRNVGEYVKDLASGKQQAFIRNQTHGPATARFKELSQAGINAKVASVKTASASNEMVFTRAASRNAGISGAREMSVLSHRNRFRSMHGTTSRKIEGMSIHREQNRVLSREGARASSAEILAGRRRPVAVDGSVSRVFRNKSALPPVTHTRFDSINKVRTDTITTKPSFRPNDYGRSVGIPQAYKGDAAPLPLNVPRKPIPVGVDVPEVRFTPKRTHIPQVSPFSQGARASLRIDPIKGVGNTKNRYLTMLPYQDHIPHI